ncbi:putative translocation protein sec63 protein [Daldinia childiae]|nr:putative translocation protein sec63 protein [Daldinia childiae]KAF3061052.1 putative translocation protein sec63 protein [Daldinia childiae]
MYDIGIIAEHSQYHRNRQEIRDMAAVYGADLLALLDHYCDPTLSRSWSPSQSQLLVGSLTPQDYYSRGREPVDWARRPLFAGFDVIRQHTSIGSKDTLSKQEDAATLFREASSPKDRTMVVVKTLKKKLAHALGVQVEDIDPRQNPSDYGVDSLMAVELRNWIWRDFGVKVAVFEILGRTAIEDLAGCVAERAG